MRKTYPRLSSSAALAAIVGRRIRKFRTEKGMDVRDVAAFLAVPVEWLRDYEAGVRLVRTYTLYQLAELFGVDVGSLLGEEPAEEPVTDVLLLRALRRIQKLGANDRQAIAELLDSLASGLTKLRTLRPRKG